VPFWELCRVPLVIPHTQYQVGAKILERESWLIRLICAVGWYEVNFWFTRGGALRAGLPRAFHVFIES
jgi:hypothetical protein